MPKHFHFLISEPTQKIAATVIQFLKPRRPLLSLSISFPRSIQPAISRNLNQKQTISSPLEPPLTTCYAFASRSFVRHSQMK